MSAIRRFAASLALSMSIALRGLVFTRRCGSSARGILVLPNEAGGEVLLANDGFDVHADEMVVPFGDVVHTPSAPKKIKQRLSREVAQKIVDHFNSLPQRLGRLFGGLPVFVGHPDVPALANESKDKKAYAWIQAMEVRDDGLVFKPKWSAAGRELIDNAHYKFHSPVFIANEGDYVMENGWQVYTPFGVKSVGLTNNPNWPVKPFANEAADPAAHAPQQQEGTQTMNLLQRLLALIGVDNIKTDDDVTSYVSNLVSTVKKMRDAMDARSRAESAIWQSLSFPNEATDGDRMALLLTHAETAHQTVAQQVTTLANDKADLQTRLTAAETLFANERKAHVELLLGNALVAGRITLADKDEWAGKLTADFAAASVELANAKPVMKTTSVLGTDLADRTGQQVDRSAKILTLVNERMASAGENYEVAFIHVQRDPKNAALFTKS